MLPSIFPYTRLTINESIDLFVEHLGNFYKINRLPLLSRPEDIIVTIENNGYYNEFLIAASGYRIKVIDASNPLFSIDKEAKLKYGNLLSEKDSVYVLFTLDDFFQQKPYVGKTSASKERVDKHSSKNENFSSCMNFIFEETSDVNKDISDFTSFLEGALISFSEFMSIPLGNSVKNPSKKLKLSPEKVAKYLPVLNIVLKTIVNNPSFLKIIESSKLIQNIDAQVWKSKGNGNFQPSDAKNIAKSLVSQYVAYRNKNYSKKLKTKRQPFSPIIPDIFKSETDVVNSVVTSTKPTNNKKSIQEESSSKVSTTVKHSTQEYFTNDCLLKINNIEARVSLKVIDNKVWYGLPKGLNFKKSDISVKLIDKFKNDLIQEKDTVIVKNNFSVNLFSTLTLLGIKGGGRTFLMVNGEKWYPYKDKMLTKLKAILTKQNTETTITSLKNKTRTSSIVLNSISGNILELKGLHNFNGVKAFIEKLPDRKFIIKKDSVIVGNKRYAGNSYDSLFKRLKSDLAKENNGLFRLKKDVSVKSIAELSSALCGHWANLRRIKISNLTDNTNLQAQLDI